MYCAMTLVCTGAYNKNLSAGPKGEDWPEALQYVSFQLTNTNRNEFLFDSPPTLSWDGILSFTVCK